MRQNGKPQKNQERFVMINGILKCFLEVLRHGDKCLPYSSGEVALRVLLDLLDLIGCKTRIKSNGISASEFEYLYDLASEVVKDQKSIINDENLGVLHLLLILKDQLKSMLKSDSVEKRIVWDYVLDNSRIRFADIETRNANINREIFRLLKGLKRIGGKDRVKYLNLSGAIFLDGFEDSLFLTDKMEKLLTDYFSVKNSKVYLLGQKVHEPMNYSDFLKMKEILSSETKLTRSYKKYLTELDLNILRKKILITSLELPFIIPAISMNQSIKHCIWVNNCQLDILNLSAVNVKPEDFCRMVEQSIINMDIYYFRKFLNMIKNSNRIESFVNVLNKDSDQIITSEKVCDLLNEPDNSDFWAEFINEYSDIREFTRKYLKIKHITNWVKIWDRAVAKHILPDVYQ
jgi:hypothetical protein